MSSTTKALHVCHTCGTGHRVRHACSANPYTLCQHGSLTRALLRAPRAAHPAGSDPAQRGRAEVVVQLLRVQRAHGAQHRVAAARAAQRGEPGQLRGGLQRRALGLARRGPCGARRRQLPLGLLGPAVLRSQLRKRPDV